MSDGRRQPAPLDPPMVPFTLAGTALWAVAGMALLVSDSAPEEWLWTCLAGVVMGVLLLPPMAIHDRNRARRRATSGDRSANRHDPANRHGSANGHGSAGTTSTSASS